MHVPGTLNAYLHLLFAMDFKKLSCVATDSIDTCLVPACAMHADRQAEFWSRLRKPGKNKRQPDGIV